MPCSFITCFSSCFCVIISLGSPSSQTLWPWNLFLTSEIPHGLIGCLSVCMPDLSFLFFKCTFSTFSASAPAMVFLQCPGFLQKCMPLFRSSFYLDGPFLLGLPGNFLLKTHLNEILKQPAAAAPVFS